MTITKDPSRGPCDAPPGLRFLIRGRKQSARLPAFLPVPVCLPPGVMACGTADIAAIRSAACCYDSTLGDFRKKVYLQLFSLQLLLPPCPTELFLRLFAPSAVPAYNKQPQDAPPQRLPPLQNPLTTAPAPSTVCIRRSAPRQAASAYL